MSRSETLFNNAQKHIPGGVNSPVRAFKSVGGTPLFFKHAEGAYVLDEDDKRYVDYVGSWGPMILGHSHPDVLDAVRRQLDHGLSYGAPTALEVEMADLVCSMVPSMEIMSPSRMTTSVPATTASFFSASMRSASAPPTPWPPPRRAGSACSCAGRPTPTTSPA